MTVQQNAHLTFKQNIGVTRHGWLRLTPAYSYTLVSEALANVDASTLVLDPFAGTGTTGLVAAEKGLNAHLIDINPFLIWLERVKTRNYSTKETAAAKELGALTVEMASAQDSMEIFLPPLYRIERWWPANKLTGECR